MHHSIRFCILLFLCIARNIPAQQDLQVGNQFIIGDVEKTSGHITVLPVDAQDHGRIGLDQQLSFQYKSFFTCQIGNQFFTNNEVIAPFPANAFHLNDGISAIIKDPNKISDTLRTTWLNKNGVDIIQDVYPIAFTKSGQVVYKWSFVNHNSSPISVACQFLEDMQISDPHSAKGNISNDGPLILTRWEYTPYWVQYPNSTFTTLPWFYIGFLFNLPNPPSFNPGLSGMGYLDYGEPLNLIKPVRMTVGDWFTLASTIFGSNQTWPINASSVVGPDCGILTEFLPKSIPSGKTVEVGRTSYGTGEYERCVGNLFSLVFYPHHLTWDSSKMVYTPNPIHIEKFVVDPSQVNPSSNTKITLTVGNNLTLVDSVCNNVLGKSHTKPDTLSNGEFIGPGAVNYFDWWACASPALLCTGPIIDTLEFTATSSLGQPTFIDSQGNSDCQMLVTLDCAETDINPPEFKDTLVVHDSSGIAVRDWRTTDKGLQSIIWIAEQGTDTTKVIVLPPKPAIQPCYNDKVNHILKVIQLDSTIGGCYDFTFTDCLGHQSFKTVCMPSHPLAIPDTLQPVITVTENHSPSGQWFISISDNRSHDTGIDTIYTLSDTNVVPISQSLGCLPSYSLILKAIDTTKNASICLRITDCAKNIHDTCISFKGIPDFVNGENQFKFGLEANHPNPFSQVTTFTFTISEYGQTRLLLYDELGKEVAHIFEGQQQPDTYNIDFDGSKLSSGSYIVRIESGKEVASKRIIIER